MATESCCAADIASNVGVGAKLFLKSTMKVPIAALAFRYQTYG